MTTNDFQTQLDQMLKCVYMDAALRMSGRSSPVEGELGKELEALNTRAREIEAEWALDHHRELAGIRKVLHETFKRFPEVQEPVAKALEKVLTQTKMSPAMTVGGAQ